MPFRLRRTVADAKTSEGWVDREFASATFADERLGKRFCALLEQLSSSPGDAIPLVCQDCANTKAAYRFLDNERVNEADILAGHFHATRDRAATTSGPILVLYDTTEFTYQREDIEAVGKTRINIAGAYRDGAPRFYTACSILMHSSLAVTTEDLLLACLRQLARLGGYLDRAHDPPPGNIGVWRGMARLTDIAIGFQLGARLVGN